MWDHGLRNFGDQKKKKNQNSEIREPCSTAAACYLTCSQNSKRKDLEPNRTQAWPPTLERVQDSKKNNKRGLSAPNFSLSLSSLVPLFSPSNSLSFFSKISHIWYFYHLMPPFDYTHFLIVILLAYLLINFLL